MNRAVLTIIFFILLVSSAGAQSVNIITIDEQGNALWTIEKRMPITSPVELNEWKLAIEKGNSLYRYSKEIQDVRERVNMSLVAAQNQTNRTMSIEDYRISYEITDTISETLGIIRFSFEWNNFTRMNASKIYIGDGFSGLMLSSDDVLIIQIPEGYDVESVSPGYDKRDGNKLVWDGTMYHDFKKKEPAVVLAPVKPVSFTWFFGIIAAFITISSISLLFWVRKRSRPDEDDEEIGMSQHYDLPSKYLEDEEMIQQILLKYNGQAYQSDIVRESGLSKSKISNVLADMKDQGLIIKIRKGRGNVIRLVKESSQNPNS